MKVILGDMLNQNYVLDPRVKGAVTVQTSQPLARDDLLPTLDTLLRMNGAALVRSGTGYQVVPLAGALQGTVTPQLALTPLRPGYGVVVVPLKYVGVDEMQKLLEPFAPAGSIVRADEMRNLLVLAGTRQELTHLVETIGVFDVDSLAGMSVGLFPLKSVEAKTVSEEIDKLLGAKGAAPLAGMVRVMPIERLNALLVVTQQPKYLDEVRTWIERLDRTSEEAGKQLYVYQVQNAKAEHLAEVLGDLFGGQKAKPAAPRPPQVAPGLTGAQLSSGSAYMEMAEQATTGTLGTTGTMGTTGTLGSTQGPSFGASRGGQAGKGGGAGGVTATQAGEVSIIADAENNSLLILATAAEYEKIEAALRKLDIVPRQVLVEATIAEVTLSGDLQYGLQWFFDNNVGAYKGTGALDVTNGLKLADVLKGAGSGFTYALTDASGFVRLFLKMLADESRIKVLSSPQLMVTDNQTAQIRVGDQVPVNTGETTGTAGTTTSFQYRDTGVLLQVTPRVNAGGLVSMEVSQEVSIPGPSSGNAGGNPTISQRSIQSSVVVQSGDTLVLGGLIRDENTTLKQRGAGALQNADHRPGVRYHHP